MQKILAGVLLTIGFMFLSVTIAMELKKNPSEEDKSASLGGLIIGVPATVAGGYLILGMWQQKERTKRDRLSSIETIFLEQLQEHNGHITSISFAIAAKISLEDAKQYLNTKAKELDGHFDVNDDGGITYKFYLS